AREEAGVVLSGAWGALQEEAAHDRVALLGAAHRFHHVAEVGRMQVAEEAHEATVRIAVQQHFRSLRLGGVALGPYGSASLIGGEEVFAVERKAHALLAREHGVWLRAGGNEHR